MTKPIVYISGHPDETRHDFVARITESKALIKLIFTTTVATCERVQHAIQQCVIVNVGRMDDALLLARKEPAIPTNPATCFDISQLTDSERNMVVNPFMWSLKRIRNAVFPEQIPFEVMRIIPRLSSPDESYQYLTPNRQLSEKTDYAPNLLIAIENVSRTHNDMLFVPLQIAQMKQNQIQFIYTRQRPHA